MAFFQKFNFFPEQLAEGRHNLSSDDLRVYLTNATPLATMSSKQELPEISSSLSDGYSPGGNGCSVASSSQTNGTYKLVLNDPATWTSTGTIGPFKAAVLYNASSAFEDLIGAWSYPTSITLEAGETFKVDFSSSTGVLTIS